VAFVVAGAAAVAGVVLVAWSRSSAGHLLGHDPGGAGAAGQGAWLLLWFTASWLLMSMATMLPTSIPLLSAVAVVVGDRADARRLLAAVVAAYLGVWALAGLVLAVVDLGLHRLVERTVLGDHRPLMLAGTLLVAGAYQLSSRSARCLRACRTPLSFLAHRWDGRGPASARAVRVGVDYGLSCLGCCAALMLVMFAVGMSSPLAMAGFGGLVAVHKLAPWGDQLAVATGVVLLANGALLGALHLAGGS
jgi:predicted metal-binding membrane protein